MTQDETPCLSLLCRVKLCLFALHKAAHKAEHPMHMSYLAAVYYTSHGSYGYIALACCVTMAVSWEFKS